MANIEGQRVDSSIGAHEIDSEGSVIGVARLDAEKSYEGVGELLQKFINDSEVTAWEEITAKIDYTYTHIGHALSPLIDETNLAQEIESRLKQGQKLLFKPNLVGVQNIDPQTHGPGPISTSCTEWPFIAALMRWFHDKLRVSYHQMSLGEAATLMPVIAGSYSMIHPEGKKVTVEAALEGKSGEFYGGWGFYFARKYLAENLDQGAADDPMEGFEESVSGVYIPPGEALDKLMVYDLNQISDDPSRGREVQVPGGINYQSIALHKAIIGGDPEDADDLKAYPGCILVNVPKFKVHAIALFTNIIKNLGIGLYPMQYAAGGSQKWDYSVPRDQVPGMKGGIPHGVWVADLDPDTSLPKRDSSGEYIVNKTGGITATMIDIIKAVSGQDIFMIHVVDGIEAINLDHTGSSMGLRTPEGLVVAGLDPVAADLLCARYMFSNVPIDEALKTKMDDGTGGFFPQAVPIPRVDGKSIVTETGYDCPLSRDICFKKAEERGLGQRKYYVHGHDAVTDLPIVSLMEHLGTVRDNKFADLITETLFFDVQKFPWDMQRTAVAYMEALDELTGSSIKKNFFKAYDEDGDGIVTYEEFGKKGVWESVLHSSGRNVSKMASDPLAYLKNAFNMTFILKHSDPSMNAGNHDVFGDFSIGIQILAAFQMSQMEFEAPDTFVEGLIWGKGKWPSLQTAQFFRMGMTIYGAGFPASPGVPSLYSAALFYADLTQNGGKYAGEYRVAPDPQAAEKYVSDVSSGRIEPLDFTFYVPTGFDNLAGQKVPNTEATTDPEKILTASFKGGREIWP